MDRHLSLIESVLLLGIYALYIGAVVVLTRLRTRARLKAASVARALLQKSKSSTNSAGLSAAPANEHTALLPAGVSRGTKLATPDSPRLIRSVPPPPPPQLRPNTPYASDDATSTASNYESCEEGDTVSLLGPASTTKNSPPAIGSGTGALAAAQNVGKGQPGQGVENNIASNNNNNDDENDAASQHLDKFIPGVIWDSDASVFSKVQFVFEFPVSVLRALSIPSLEPDTWGPRHRFLAVAWPLPMIVLMLVAIRKTDAFSGNLDALHIAVLPFLIGLVVCWF
jgi:hypothetical protein